ncbi:MAG: YeeE/YedE family protein [Planctomycetes bacterium]|nr:YeeE/YedE family protein [Planctomycetota bacterium]
MSSVWKQPRWSPYVVGAAIGVLSWITFGFMGKALGTSTTLVRAAGALESIAAPEHVEQNAYFAKYLGTAAEPKPVFEWQFALVLLLGVGALIAARLAGSKRREYVPELWRERFGDSKALRYGAAFVGGAVMLFGARLAGGCTSGHGISGGLQLAVSSWTFVISMLVAGVVTALVVYRKGGRHVG